VGAIIHLAGLSNDPLGFVDPELTREINVTATVRLAEMARNAGVNRFIFSSSCSVYGAAVEDWVDETTLPRPVTPYGESKVLAENALTEMASESFCTVSLRNATAFGYSPYLRTDLVVNDLVAGAFLSGNIRLNSDGSAHRPLVHIRDIAQAMLCAVQAPAAEVNGQVINVGNDAQNYTVMEIAQTVARHVEGSTLSFADNAGPDKRSYRVRFGKIGKLLPGFRCEWDLSRGISDLIDNYRRIRLNSTESTVRLAHLRQLQDKGELDDRMRWNQAVVSSPGTPARR
jgi:nucleoside-diphosphate-sugar epimerase